MIATQPGVHASDFRSGNGRIAGTVGVPHLKRALHNVPGNIVVPYARSSVLGHDDADADADGEEGEGSGSLGGQIAVELGEWARDQCGAEMVEVDASSMLLCFSLLYFFPLFLSTHPTICATTNGDLIYSWFVREVRGYEAEGAHGEPWAA